jgi:hypothetical protein
MKALKQIKYMKENGRFYVYVLNKASTSTSNPNTLILHNRTVFSIDDIFAIGRLRDSS